jgi:hypothetical protein
MSSQLDDEVEGYVSAMKKLKKDISNTTKQINNNFKSQILSIATQLKVLRKSKISYQGREFSRTKRVLRCFYCGRVGHGFIYCHDATQNNKNKLIKQLENKTFDFKAWELKRRISVPLNLRAALQKSTPSA